MYSYFYVFKKSYFATYSLRLSFHWPWFFNTPPPKGGGTKKISFWYLGKVKKFRIDRSMPLWAISLPGLNRVKNHIKFPSWAREKGHGFLAGKELYRPVCLVACWLGCLFVGWMVPNEFFAVFGFSRSYKAPWAIEGPLQEHLKAHFKEHIRSTQRSTLKSTSRSI